jgi:hypothetical protein
MNYLRQLKHWDRGFESHSRHGCLCAFILCLRCVLATGWSPIQGVLPAVMGLQHWKIAQGPTQGCRAIDRYIFAAKVNSSARKLFSSEKGDTCVYSGPGFNVVGSQERQALNLCAGERLALHWPPYLRVTYRTGSVFATDSMDALAFRKIPVYIGTRIPIVQIIS